MLMINYRYRIYPSADQQAKMLDWLESCRGVYNYALRELKDSIASRKCDVDKCSLSKEYIIPGDRPFPSYHLQQNNLPKAKKAHPKLKEVHSQVLQTTIRRLHDTWDAFRSRGFGFPRFKKFGQFKSFLYPQFKESPLKNGSIKLPKIGEVTINLHRPIPDGFTIKQVRVLSRVRHTHWYVVITIALDVEIPKNPPYGRAIGIDLGLEKFLTTSDNFTVERPQFLKALKGKLKLLQPRAARKSKRSKNWEKAQVKVAKLHHKIANTRKDFHLKTAHLLCDQAETIFAEDLNTVGLNKGMLRSYCIDASFGQFLTLLEWVCGKRGNYFQKVDPRGTSQTCPECGATVQKPLKQREHSCPECNYQTHRDHAAAQMVKLRGLELVPSDGGEWKLSGNSVLSGANSLDKCLSRNSQSRG
jgi:putative transposase